MYSNKKERGAQMKDSLKNDLSDFEFHGTEPNKQYKRTLVLSTPAGEKSVDALIIVDKRNCGPTGDEDEPLVYITIKYEGKEICGHGKDYSFAKAFADLQKHLPENVKLKCCLACRYGNMCAVGNYPDEVFCTKDVEIKQIDDLYFYTEDGAERKKRSRHYTDMCDSFCDQSRDFFTYNDYLYLL